MTVGAGDDVAHYAATPERPREDTGWHSRFLAALGGAVVVVALILLASGWSDGLRPSTFDELRSDIASGAVQEWYVASSLDRGELDLMEAQQAPLDSAVVTDDGVSTEPDPDGSGGILVWRTWGSPGWQVATSDVPLGSFTGMATETNEASEALVSQLREAGVAMRPFDYDDDSALERLATVGALLVLGGLLFGAAPRVGTRWFWFWVLLNAPLALGFIAYAVMELIGFRRRPDPPLTKRLNGFVGFVGALALGLLIGVTADFLRSRGVPLPM